MRGQILVYRADAGEGTISGQDGNRYVFKGTDYHGDVLRIRQGGSVDFVVAEDGRAVDVFGLNAAPVTVPINIIAGLLGIFCGTFGVHKFVLGFSTGNQNYINTGVVMLVCGTLGWILVLPGMAMAIIGFIEGIIYLVKREEDFEATYIKGEKRWF